MTPERPAQNLKPLIDGIIDTRRRGAAGEIETPAMVSTVLSIAKQAVDMGVLNYSNMTAYLREVATDGAVWQGLVDRMSTNRELVQASPNLMLDQQIREDLELAEALQMGKNKKRIAAYLKHLRTIYPKESSRFGWLKKMIPGRSTSSAQTTVRDIRDSVSAEAGVVLDPDVIHTVTTGEQPSTDSDEVAAATDGVVVDTIDHGETVLADEEPAAAVRVDVDSVAQGLQALRQAVANLGEGSDPKLVVNQADAFMARDIQGQRGDDLIRILTDLFRGHRTDQGVREALAKAVRRVSSNFTEARTRFMEIEASISQAALAEAFVDQRVSLNDGKNWRYDRIGERGHVDIGDSMYRAMVVTRLTVGINQGHIRTYNRGLCHVGVNQGIITAENPVSVDRMDGELEIHDAAYVASFGPAAQVSFESKKVSLYDNSMYYEKAQLYLPADATAIANMGKYGLGAHPENVYILPELSAVDFNNLNNENSLQERYVTYRDGERVFLFALARSIKGENWGIAAFEIPQNTDGTRDISKAELVLGRKVTKAAIPSGFLLWFATNTSLAVPAEQAGELADIISPLVADVPDLESALPKPVKVDEKTYTPVRRIGGGRYGEVYLATNPDRQQVVIKVANLRLSTSDIQAFDDEQLTLIGLENYQRNHGFLINGQPLTPDYLGKGKTEEGRNFFIMTEAEGKDVGSLIQAERVVRYEDVVTMADQLCMVYESLHNAVRRGDRDFQVVNIFWDDIHRKITVIDWNLLTASFDQSGVNAQALRGNDIYSIGMVLYRLSVKDSSPFRGMDKITPENVDREKIEAGLSKIPSDNPLRKVIIKSILTHPVISDVLQVADSDKYSGVEAMRADVESIS